MISEERQERDFFFSSMKEDVAQDASKPKTLGENSNYKRPPYSKKPAGGLLARISDRRGVKRHFLLALGDEMNIQENSLSLHWSCRIRRTACVIRLHH